MKCDRCHKDTDMWTMSMFNEQIICMECKERERRSPRYREAVEKAGDRNFPGIGP